MVEVLHLLLLANTYNIKEFPFLSPQLSVKKPLAQLLFVVVFDATVANPIVVDHFVRFIANVENTTAAIADRVIAIVKPIHLLLLFIN
jgi:hypothetical protein